MASESSNSNSTAFAERGEWESPQDSTDTSNDSESQSPSANAANTRDETLNSQPGVTQQSPGQDFPPDPISGWWKGALAGLIGGPILFVVFFGITYLHFMFQNQITTGLLVITSVLMVFLRLLIPYSLYKDAKLLTNAPVPLRWRPNRALYLLGALFVPPPFEYMTSTMYLYRRHKAVGRP